MQQRDGQSKNFNGVGDFKRLDVERDVDNVGRRHHRRRQVIVVGDSSRGPEIGLRAGPGEQQLAAPRDFSRGARTPEKTGGAKQVSQLFSSLNHLIHFKPLKVKKYHTLDEDPVQA